jgi:DNA helicase HerA-like ATPase
MTVAIEIGQTATGEPASLDLEELLAARLLVQGNSGSGKSNLLRPLLEQSVPWVQQAIIDPEGEEEYTERGLQVAAERARVHRAAAPFSWQLVRCRVSTILNLEGLDAENQIPLARDHWYPMLVIVDEAQLFAPAVAGEVSDEARTVPCRHDELDMPRRQARTCRTHSEITACEAC